MPKGWARRLRSPLHIFFFALAVRLIAIPLLEKPPFSLDSILWKSGLEMGSVASSIVSGQGFSSPFRAPSGPTAWLPPLYPYLIAGVFKGFGVYSNVSTWIVVGLQCLFSALICPVIQSIGREIFGEAVGVWSAWVWACFPYSAAIPIIIIWESSLSALLLGLLLMLTLRLGKAASLRGFLAFGALWGLAALTNVALVSLLAFFAWWIWYRRRQAGVNCGWSVAVALLVFFACIAPWIIRDYRVFGQLIPVRDNFGEELWMGNRDGGTGEWVPGVHPSQNKYELEQYIRLGEISYVAQKQRDAQAYIAARPVTFVRLTAGRILYFWFGPRVFVPILYFVMSVPAFLGLGWMSRCRRPESRLFLAILGVYPCVYYFTHVFARYRYPIEPEMVMLAVFAVRYAISRLRHPGSIPPVTQYPASL
jgi:4-amino-4-deoxy-L-arabinose transferase-like glycosyltransferase